MNNEVLMINVDAFRSHGEPQMFKDTRHADVKDGDINKLDGEK